jgi:hypothetical protein
MRLWKLTDREVVERVRRLNKRRSWLGWGLIGMGLFFFILFMFLNYRITSQMREVANTATKFSSPSSEELIKVSLDLAHAAGLRLGLEIGASLGALAVAVHIGATVLSERRQGQLLVALFDAQEEQNKPKIH